MKIERKTKKIALCALFVALHIVSGFVRIPAPFAPITLQLQVALLAGILLGAKWGALSVFCYLALGLMGLPIFASGGGGLAYTLQPTFGFLIGFVVAAFVAGRILQNRIISNGRIACALVIGLGIAYIVGVIYSAFILAVYLHQTSIFHELLIGLILITLPKDVLLCLLTIPLVKRLLPHVS